eukprot:UN16313
MLDDGYLPMENGYTRFEDGSVLCSCLTPLPDATSKQFEWWFRYCDNDEKYQMWHPEDHVKGTWKNLSPSEVEKLPDNWHLNNEHHVTEHMGKYKGNPAENLRICFRDPKEIFTHTIPDDHCNR